MTEQATPTEKDSPEAQFGPDERNAMRGFLQRSEVRLSSMHRVAVGFLSGAGLLFLLPVFLKDGVLAIVRAILDYPVVGLTGDTGWQVVVYVCLLYPFVLSLSIPAVALLLLVEDIVRFYFVSHAPDYPQELFSPRFILTGVAFSPDESPAAKARILRYQYGTDLINFVISHADAKSRYYHDVIDKPDRMIVPRTRKLPRLIKLGVVDIPSGKAVEDLADDDIVRVQGKYVNRNGEQVLMKTAFVDRTVSEIDGFNAAMGLAGVYDRALYQEVAKTEVSMVRHAIKLRRMVLRYFQALLILIWTSTVTFLMLPFLQDEQGRFPVLLVFSVGYFIWAAVAPLAVQLPLYWLTSASKPQVRAQSVAIFQKSDAIVKFGRLTQWFSYGALALTVLALVIELVFGF